MTDATKTLIQILTDIARILCVYAVFMGLILLLMANWALPYFSVLKPQIVLIAVFYWSLYRPTLMPPWAVFITGLFLDMSGSFLPIGTHALSYLLVSGLVRPRRRMLMGQPFMIVWVAFIFAVLIDMAVKILSLSLVSQGSIVISTILVNVLVTVLSFPLVLMILVLVHRVLPSTRGMIAT